MKKLIAIILIAELLIAYFVLAPACILRRDHVRAFSAWRDNPTPAASAELARQKQITQLHSLGFSAVVFGVMAGVTLFGARSWTRNQTGRADLKHETHVAS